MDGDVPADLGWLYRDGDSESRHTSSLLLARLAWVPTPSSPQSQAALEAVLAEGWWDAVGEVADAWQLHATLATRLETSARLRGWAEYGRPTALVGLIESAGEQLMLGAASLVEARLWQRNRTDSPAHTPAAEVGLVGDEVAQRACAEAAMFFLLATGHAVANVIARALTLHPSTHEQARRLYKSRHGHATDFSPAADRNHDWRSLTDRDAQTLKLLAEATTGAGDTARLMANVASEVVASDWRLLNSVRQTSWHRLRPRSQGLGGTGTTSALHPIGTTGWRLRVSVDASDAPAHHRDPFRSADALTDLTLGVATSLSARMRVLLALCTDIYKGRSAPG